MILHVETIKHLYTLSFVKRSARGALDRKTVGSFLKISFSRHPHEIFAKCARAYTPVRRVRWENKIKRIFSVSLSLTLCFDSAPWLWFGRSRIFDLHKNYRLFCNLGERTLSIFFNFFFRIFIGRLGRGERVVIVSILGFALIVFQTTRPWGWPTP